MSFHYFSWHGLYLHPQLALEGTGVLAAAGRSDSLLNGSVSTGAWRRFDLGELPDPVPTTNQHKGCSDIVTSLPSVLPFEVSLQLQEGSTDMSQ